MTATEMQLNREPESEESIESNCQQELESSACEAHESTGAEKPSYILSTLANEALNLSREISCSKEHHDEVENLAEETPQICFPYCDTTGVYLLGYYAMDGRVYTEYDFRVYYEDDFDFHWNKAQQVTKQVVSTLQWLAGADWEVDDLIYVENMDEKKNLKLWEKYQIFAQSLAIPLHWRRYGLERWNLAEEDTISHEHGELLFKQWREHFTKNQLRSSQQSQRKRRQRTAFAAFVRKLCGSGSIAQQVMNTGVHNRDTLMKLMFREHARKSEHKKDAHLQFGAAEPNCHANGADNLELVN